MYAADFRRIAREHLAGKWKLAIGAALLAALFGALLVGNQFLPEVEINLNKQSIRSISDIFEQLSSHGVVSLAGTLNLLQIILGGVIQLGYAKFLLKQHDGEEHQVKDLFSYFDYFGTGFCQAFLRGLYTVLLALLLIIPGIVANYRYAMTPYILAENPELTASEAIDRSKWMMDGHKWRLFCLDCSFIGWNLLCGLTGNLGFIALNPYTNAARTAFYRDLQRRQ